MAEVSGDRVELYVGDVIRGDKRIGMSGIGHCCKVLPWEYVVLELNQIRTIGKNFWSATLRCRRCGWRESASSIWLMECALRGELRWASAPEIEF